MEVTSKEFYKNIKRIPGIDSVEYRAFFDAEWHKIEYGVTINGIYFPGWLYWHTNHWKIQIDTEDGKRPFLNPELRDNEWIIAEHLNRAEEEKKGLMIFGTRRFGKSEFAASYIARSATIYSGTENVISGGNAPDIKLITDKCDKGLVQLHPDFQFGRIEDNWTKQVTLGFKDKKGNRNQWSQILVRNFKDGLETEAAAGTTPKSFIMDEVGKYPFLQCFEAAKPGFATPYGWRCVPILTGTGGTFEYGDSAQEIFTNPQNYNFLSVDLEEEQRKVGVFIPGKYAIDVPKIKRDLNDYLGIPKLKEDDGIEIMVTPEDGQDWIEDHIYIPALKSNDSTAYPKARMYYPTTVDDCFMTDSGNEFPIQAAKDHLKSLEVREITGQYIVLERDAKNKVIHKFAERGLTPVNVFPVKSKDNKNAPIVVWEFPISNAPYGLYIAGADPYNQGQSEFSESLGTVYIYKRMTDVTGERYQDMPVAAIASRPKTMKEWHEQVEMLLEFYGAICFPENEAGTFIQYFDEKNKAHLLADGLDFLKEINPTTSTRSRIKGAAATVKNIQYMMSVLLDYTKEEIQIGTSEDGKPIKALGIVRILDKMLLREIINYNKKGNFDRIVAFRHALAYAKHLDKYSPIVKLKEVVKETKQEYVVRSPFTNSRSGLGNSSNPFATKFRASV